MLRVRQAVTLGRLVFVSIFALAVVLALVLGSQLPSWDVAFIVGALAALLTSVMALGVLGRTLRDQRVQAQALAAQATTARRQLERGQADLGALSLSPQQDRGGQLSQASDGAGRLSQAKPDQPS